MAISAGDAIFNFLGDATQLDQTWAKVETDANAKAPIVQQQVSTVGDAWTRTGEAAATAAQQTTQAGEQIGAAAQSAAAASGEAAQTASPEWLALARATDSATRATIEHDVAQKELQQAIEAAARAQQGDHATLVALAAAEERVATTAASLAAAQKEVELASQQATTSMRSEAEAALQSELALKSAADAALLFGTETKVAAEEASFSMAEAKGTIALAGEEIGINMPRHLRSFVAELPGVGPILEAAFSGVALLVLIQLLVEGAEKLSEFVSETYIYTEAAKKEYEQQVELNKEIEKSADNVKKLKEAYELIGASPVEKDIIEFQRLDKQVEDTKRSIEGLQNFIALYRDRGFDTNGNPITDVQVADAQRNIAKLQALLKEYEQERTNVLKDGNIVALAEQIRHGEASINAQKTVQEARIELARAESDLRLTLAKAGYSSLIEAQQAFDEQTYQIRLKALQQTVAILAQDPERNADRIKELNAQIEALEDAHQAKLIEIRVKGVKALQDAIKEALSLTTAVPIDDIIPLPSELNVRIQQISDILAQFGIKSGQVWQEEVDNAQAAFDKIKNSGVATYAELLQIREKLLNAKIGQAIDSGDLAVANQYKKELSDVEKEMVRLGISTDRTHLKTRQMFATWRNNIPRDAKLWKDLGNFGKSALEDLAAGFEQAVASSVLGAQSIGEAMKQMLASVLASIAGQAAVLSLFYLAKGFGYTADFMYLPAENAFQAAAIFGAVAVASAAAAYGLSSHGGGGGGETAGAPAGTQPIETSGATQTQAQPVQTTNVQRFAAGGMVFGPTLSILGDSMNNAASATAAALSGPGQTEVAIPLDDDRSTSAIAAAIVKHMPQPINKTIIRGKSLKHLIRDISHEVESGNVTLKASHAGAVRKRS